MMNIALVAPGETLYTGPVDEVMVRTSCGDVKILTGHAEYLAEIAAGTMKIRASDRVISGKTSKGILYIKENGISVFLFEPYELSTQYLN